ncbi:AAA+-type ATPase [Exophiala dermatitidis]|nr:AAA+-type ATPase [Exophiala dermatitidis]
MSSFIVRPSNTDKDPFRVKLTAVSMLSLKLKSGDTCELQSIDFEEHDQKKKKNKKKLAIAWEASGAGMKDTIVQTSKLLQEVYGFKLGDKILVSRSTHAVQDSAVISIEHLGTPSLSEEDKHFWEKYARLSIPGVDECLVETQRLRFRTGIQVTEFVVRDIGDSESLIGRVTKDTRFRIRAPNEDGSEVVETVKQVEFQPVSLGGVHDAIRQVQDIIGRICRPVVKRHFRLYRPVQGVLLYGSKGTGKTAFISALGQAGWTAVTEWKPGTQLKGTNGSEPQLVVVPTRYLSRKDSNGGSSSSVVVGELDKLFEQVRDFPVLVVGEVRHPNDVEQALRSEGKFAAEIELPIPSAQQRKEILLALRGGDSVPDDALVQEMADRTHGYVGADLYALVRRTLEIASDRSESVPSVPNNIRSLGGENQKQINGIEDMASLTLNENEDTANASSTQTEDVQLALRPTSTDLDEALRQIRPSALQEIFLETPNVHWTDIGGNHEIKRQLRNAVERPLKFSSRMAKLGLQPKKGVLLYGPPGCSKTLLVRALATEAGLNFLAVKGAELISMYVGESERATREVFRKARAASPSIIFFDEIDAIASRGRSGSDLNVLTTLLNEMDGFEELKNVLVVAATNKPMNIDPALMRPGRFDNVVYIGPPDLEARKEIFQKRLQRIGDGYRPEISLDEDTDEFARAAAGFSGAEVVAICQTAGEFAFDDDRDVIVVEDIRRAIESTPKSITADMLFEFESWNSARMR